MLRRLLVVGLAWVCLGAPAAARAATVSIFYYPWYGTPAHDGGWDHGNNRSAPATMRLLAGTSYVGFAAAGQFAGIYTYDFVTYGPVFFIRFCQEAHAAHLVCAPSVGPGYGGTRAGEPPTGRPRRYGATYDALWSAALAASPDVVSITSFNEWGEGTQIEPAVARPGYASYVGSWGLYGPAAQTAYLERTAYWTGQAHGGPALHSKRSS